MKNSIIILLLLLSFKSLAQFNNGDLVNIYCLGHIDGPRYLNGNTVTGEINLSSSTEYPTTGVQWRIEQTREGFVNLRCMGHIEGVRYLNGVTQTGEINMGNDLNFPATGTRWTLVRKNDGNYHIKCEGHIEGVRYVNGNTVEGTVNLSNELTYPTTGTSWRISRVNTNTGTTISRNTWINALNRVFSASCVRLNNYTPNINQYDRNERQFFRPNDSYIQLNFNGSPIRYAIPIDIVQTGPDKMYKMYINDWNTNRIVATPENGRIKITLFFEDNGVEIVGNCYNNFWCGASPAPNFNYSNSRIDIYLDLIASGGQLSYNASNIFTANVAESGPCVNNFFAFLCPSDRAGLIKGNVEATLNGHLNSQTVKALLGTLLSQLLPNGTTVNRVSVNAQGDIQIF